MSTSKSKRRGAAEGPSLGRQAQAAKERAVLDAAARILARQGPEGLSVRAVARAVGASTMVVYTLFGGREGLLDALYRDGLERLAAALEKVRGEPSLSLLADSARAYRRFALANPDYYHAMVGGLRPGTRESSAYRVLVDAVARCMEGGILIRGEPEAVADALWGLVHGFVSLELSGHFKTTRLAEARIFGAGMALLEGFRAR